MTYKAREVLNDCRVALALLEDEKDDQRWRVHWAAAVALIRAVGHVLHKVDGADKSIKEAAEVAFRQWRSTDPNHEIFREFIEKERNNLLKEYRSDVHPLTEVALAFEFTAVPLEGDTPVKLSEIVEIGENIYRPLLEGPWEGNDARDVLSIAIEWWEDQLTKVKQEALSRCSASKN